MAIIRQNKIGRKITTNFAYMQILKRKINKKVSVGLIFLRSQVFFLPL